MSNINKKEREIEGTVKGRTKRILIETFLTPSYLTLLLCSIINHEFRGNILANTYVILAIITLANLIYCFLYCKQIKVDTEQRLYKKKRKLYIDQNTNPKTIIAAIIWFIVACIYIILTSISRIEYFSNADALNFIFFFWSKIFFELLLDGKFSNVRKTIKDTGGSKDSNILISKFNDLLFICSVLIACLYQMYAIYLTIDAIIFILSI